MALTTKERRDRFEQKHKVLGRVARKIWIHVEDWPAVQKYAAKKNRAREQEKKNAS